MRHRPQAKHEKSTAAAKRGQLTRMAWNLAMENRIREQVQAKRAERMAAQGAQ